MYVLIGNEFCKTTEFVMLTKLQFYHSLVNLIVNSNVWTMLYERIDKSKINKKLKMEDKKRKKHNNK